VASTPDRMMWGATVSAHAVEGSDFHADWWRWEQRPGHIVGGATSKTAAEHLSRYKHDIGLAHTLGLDTLQYGLSWARIQPEVDAFDEKALAHYRDVFEKLRGLQIRPLCVLQEHALPAWFSEMGGWEHPEAPRRFAAYVSGVCEALGDRCRHWIPHFEPLRWLGLAYGDGLWPAPAGHGRQRSALAGIARAHMAAWAVLREASGENQVGVSLYAPALYALDPHSPWDQRVRSRAAQWLLKAFPDLLKSENGGVAPWSFIALSCPGRLGIHLAPWRVRNGFVQFEDESERPCALDGAAPDAGALERVARRLGSGDAPLLITGTGIATDDDTLRCRHLLDHVDTLLRLKGDGLPIMGFCYGSLLDGFAWHKGYGHRTGLVHVDWGSLARTPNPSAFLYQDIVRHGSIRCGTVSRFAPGWQSPHREVG